MIPNKTGRQVQLEQDEAERMLVLVGGRRSGKRYRQQWAGLPIHSVLIDDIPPISYPEDAQVALAYMATCIALQSHIVGFDLSVAADRGVLIRHCKHGVLLYGAECIQCRREGEK
jgi:hypothetical protein